VNLSNAGFSARSGLRLTSCSPQATGLSSTFPVRCARDTNRLMRGHRHQVNASVGAASALFPKFVLAAAPRYELRKVKGTSKFKTPVPALDLKFLFELAANAAGTSNRRHWHHTPSTSARSGVRLSPNPRPPHPTATFVTIASYPSYRARRASG
jgi:hypothetical protein